MKFRFLIILLLIISCKTNSQILIFKTKGNKQVSKPYLEAKREAEKAFKSGKYDLASAYYNTALSFYGANKDERLHFQEQVKKSDKLFNLKLDYLNAKSRGASKQVIDKLKNAILLIHPGSPGIIVTGGDEIIVDPPIKEIDYFSKAIKYYNNCKFWFANENLKKANKDKNKPIKNELKKQLLMEFDLLLRYQKDINYLIQKEGKQSSLTASYKDIIRKLSDINKIEPRFKPCLNYKIDYDNYLIEQILNGKTCEFVYQYYEALRVSNLAEFNKIEIQNKKKALCDIVPPPDSCDFKIGELKSSFKRAEKSYKACQLEDAKNNLMQTKNYFSNFPSKCKLPINQFQIDSLQSLIVKSTKQSELLIEIKNLFNQNKCLKAIEKSLTIDSTDYCKKTLDLSLMKCCAFRELIDSASRASSLGLYRDCQRFAESAFSLACSKTDSAVATTLFKNCKCKSEPNSKECIPPPPCDAITSKFLNIGFGLNNIKNNYIGKQNSFLFGFRNYNLKPNKHFSIGHFEELSINTPDFTNYQELSIGPLVNCILTERICNNNLLVIGTFAVASSYPFNFNNTLIINNYFTDVKTYERIQLKIEPQFTFRFKSALIGIGYQKTIYENKVKINTESIKIRLGIVF